MVGTYAAALLVIGASVPIGAAVLALSGRRRFSWIAPILGLAVITVAAWLAVRLPGEGLTALAVVVALALSSAALALPRLDFDPGEFAEGAVVALLALLAVSVPFAAEGHFGILGTGFNVDMSQHLFVAEWLQSPLAPAPPLIDQGYPVGPHSLAVAGAELTGGNLVTAFSGMTIAVPVIAALAAFAGTRSLGPRRGILAAVLVALPYLVASYLAQGAFKELFEAAFVLGFALWLVQLRHANAVGRGFALPGAVLAAGALYAYSAPGLAWLVGALVAWGLAEFAADRRRTLAAVRTALPGIAVALVALAVVIAPEAGRLAEFGGSAGNVANADRGTHAALGDGAVLRAQGGETDAVREQAPADESLDLFDDELGNLFGDVPALEVLGIWPSGDFRVEPGGGAVPAIFFYLGALIGLAALAVGIRAAVRARQRALLAALAAAVVIWLAAWALSTPYTTAKAMQMVAPILTLVALRGVLDPRFSPLPVRRGREPGAGGGTAVAGAALATAFVLGAAGSSALALANAPVGPERYTAGIAKLRERLTGEPTLLLAPPGQLAERHGAAFYGWELRGGRPICVAPFPAEGDGFDRPAPKGIRYVITLGGKPQAPFTDLESVSRRRRVALWEVEGFDPTTAPPVAIDDDEPTRCGLGLG
jgi:hypothetical protein